MAEQALLEPQPAGVLVPFVEGDPTAEQMIRTGEAALIIGCTPRTVERWVDRGFIRGGQPIPGGWRWVDARHAVAVAVANGRAHLVPDRWRHLIPQVPSPRTASAAQEANLTAS